MGAVICAFFTCLVPAVLGAVMMVLCIMVTVLSMPLLDKYHFFGMDRAVSIYGTAFTWPASIWAAATVGPPLWNLKNFCHAYDVAEPWVIPDKPKIPKALRGVKIVGASMASTSLLNLATLLQIVGVNPWWYCILWFGATGFGCYCCYCYQWPEKQVQAKRHDMFWHIVPLWFLNLTYHFYLRPDEVMQEFEVYSLLATTITIMALQACVKPKAGEGSSNRVVDARDSLDAPIMQRDSLDAPIMQRMTP